jgi:UDP-N-acetylglucosamine transferase subunit ALG13
MGDKEGSNKSRRVVFVTVGTTSFDALVRAVDSENVKKELRVKGYTHLLIQMGRGSYVPTKVVSNIIPSIFSLLSSVFYVSEIITVACQFCIHFS